MPDDGVSLLVNSTGQYLTALLTALVTDAFSTDGSGVMVEIISREVAITGRADVHPSNDISLVTKRNGVESRTIAQRRRILGG